MKLTMIRNLKGNEVLAKNILADDGTILLKKKTILTHEYINKLKELGIFFVSVEADDLEDVCEDKVLSDLKENTVQGIPNYFNNIINCNYTDEKPIEAVGNIVEHIAGQNDVNINLYEVRAFDDYTYIHSVDTCIMAIFLGTSLNMKKDELKELGIASLLHDIGKLKIPNEIINKKGKLTNDEFNIIKKHPIYARDILVKYGSYSNSVIKGVLEHHEKYNGQGYPFRVSGKNISLYARIISICDVFTAVSANRSYRKRFDPNEAYELILSGSGSMFDPDITQSFRDTFSVYPLGCNVMLSNGIEGFVIKQNPTFPDRPVIRVTYNNITKEKIIPYQINLLDNPSIIIAGLI